MTRVKRGVTSHARHAKIIDQAKGYYGHRKNTFKVALQAVEKGLQYSYRDRRNQKRNMRALWIQRINAGVRQHGLTYSQFMGSIKKLNVNINRKMLADLTYKNDIIFTQLVAQSIQQTNQ